MKYIFAPLLLIVVLILQGCPLQTKNSIDEGSYDIPSWLPGKWKLMSNDDKTAPIYLLGKDESRKANMLAFPYDSLGNISTDNYYRMILSTVGDKIFVNVYDNGDSGGEEGYYIYLLKIISNTTIKLVGVKESSVDGDIEPEKLKEWLLAHKDDDSIYDSSEEQTYLKQ